MECAGGGWLGMSFFSRFHLRNLRLATQLAVLLVVMAIVPLLLVTFYNDAVHREELLNAARERNRLQARNAAAEIDEYLDDSLADLQVLALMPSAVGFLRDEKNAAARNELSLMFHEMREAHDYAVIMLVNQSGTIILSTTPSLVGRSYLTEPAFQSAVGGNTSFDEPRYDPLEQQSFLNFSAPVRGADGIIMGAVISRLPMTTFDDLARSRVELIGAGNFGLLWNHNGILLSDTQHSEFRFRPLMRLMPDVAEKMIAEARYGPLTRELLTHPLNAPQIVERGNEILYEPGANPHVLVSFGEEGTMLGAVASLRSKRWLYGVFIFERLVLAELDMQTDRAMQAVLLVGLVAICSGILGARWWSRPLRRMTETANALAAGEMTRRVGIASRDEVGQLAVTFDAMADAVMEKDRQLREYAGKLEDCVIERTAALSESEERYRSLVQVSPDAISLMTLTGKILFCNPQLAQLHGYTRAEDLIGFAVMDLLVPADRARVTTLLRELLKTGQISAQEFSLVRKDGTPFPAELRLSIIRTPNQVDSTVIVVTRDISERKHVEAQQQLQATALQAAANGIIITDMTGTIKWCNDAFAMMTGYTPDEIIGNNPRTLVRSGKQSREFYYALWQTVRAGQVWHGQLINRRKDGHEYTEEMTITPVRVGGDAVTHLVAIKQDVTERQRAEEEIRRHAAYQAALNTVITAAVESGNDLDVVLNVTLDEILRAMNVTMAGIWVTESVGHTRAFAMRGMALGFERIVGHMSLIHQYDKDFLGVVADWTRVDNRFGSGMLELGIRASVLVPLFVDGKAVGGMAIAYADPHAWSPEEIAFVQTIVRQLNSLIERVRLLDEALLRAEQFGLLYQAGLTVNGSLDAREQMRLLCQTAMQAVHAEHVGFFLYHPTTNELRFEFGVGADLDLDKLHTWSFRVGEERGLVGWVAQTRKPYYLPDIERDPRWVKGTLPMRSALWIPLAHEEILQGVIMVASLVAEAFSAQDQILMTLFASQISIAMENARLYENAVRAAERRAILHQASQEVIAAGIDLERVYQAIHHAAARLMPCEAFVIALYDQTRAENVAVYLVDRGERCAVVRSAPERGLMGQVIPSGKAVLINELPQTDAFVHFGDEQRVQSVLAVPMRSGARTIGMLSAQSYQTHAYTPDDQVLLEMLAANAASVLENARLFQETRRRLAALESLSRVSAALRTAQTLDQMTGMLLDETLVVLRAHAATVWLHDPGKNVLYLAAARGFPSDAAPLKPGEGITGQVFVSGQVYLSPNFRADPHTSEINRAIVPGGLRGAVVPIRTTQESIGVLFVSVQEPDYLDQDQVHLLTTLAEMAGNAIHRQRLHNQTQHRLEQVQALRTVDMAITSSMDLDVTLNILLERAATQLGMDGADILAFNAPLRMFELVTGRGLRARVGEHTRVRLGEGLAGTAALERRAIMLADASAYLTLQTASGGARAPGAKFELEESVKAYYGVPLVAKGQIKGVLELFHSAPRDLDSDGVNFLEAIANQAAIAMDNSQLFHDLERSNVELALAYDTTIEGWSRTLDLRDEETEGHTQRVTELTVRLARAMGMNDVELVTVRRGALLHDIGKMGVPDHILLKPGPLTDDEWELMRRHPLYAYQLLAPIKFLGQAIDIPYCHHEHWDGTGYPRGLVGEQIPLTARMFAVVDVWDALTSNRPYRVAWTPERTRDYILSMRGKQFDPQVVTALLRVLGL